LLTPPRRIRAAQFDKVFAQGQLPDDIPEVEIPYGTNTFNKVVTLSHKLSSSEAKRMIRQSAVSVDGKKIIDPNAQITPADGMIIQVGKRRFAKLKVK
jgi:tyrosyl-tRNA synthetase